jgi:hypothetical protein
MIKFLRNLWSAVGLSLALCTYAQAQGYLNPPVYATGTIFAQTGVTGSTVTPIKNAYNPNNLNVYNNAPINVWTITMPFPAFDGQIINIGCPGGNITTFAIGATLPDTIGTGGPTSCTQSNNSLFMYQYQGQTGVWKFITASSGSGGGGSTLTVTDGTHTVTPVTTETFSGATVSGLSPNATVTIPAPGTGTVTSVSITPGPGITQSGSPITTSGAITVGAIIATNSNIWTGTVDTLIDSASAQSSIATVTLNESGGTFSPNFATAINLELPLSHTDCPCTIANPTNVYAGLSGNITLIQSATGTDTISTWGSTWKFSGGAKPTLSTAANSIDILPYYCRTTTFCVVTLIGGAQ